MPNTSVRFWARSRTNARLTAVAASALVVTLGAVSWFVWSSPDSPVREATDTVVAAANPLTAQNELLQQQLKRSKQTVASQNGKLKNAAAAAAASAAAHAKQVASLQQQLARTQDRLGALEAGTDTDAGADQDTDTNTKAGTGSTTPRPTKPPKAPAAGAPGDGSKTPDEEPATITAPTRDALLNPEHRYFGMYTEQAPFNWATLDATAKKIGVGPNVVGYFSGWDEDFRVSAVQRA